MSDETVRLRPVPGCEFVTSAVSSIVRAGMDANEEAGDRPDSIPLAQNDSASARAKAGTQWLTDPSSPNCNVTTSSSSSGIPGASLSAAITKMFSVLW